MISTTSNTSDQVKREELAWKYAVKLIEVGVLR